MNNGTSTSYAGTTAVVPLFAQHPQQPQQQQQQQHQSEQQPQQSQQQQLNIPNHLAKQHQQGDGGNLQQQHQHHNLVGTVVTSGNVVSAGGGSTSPATSEVSSNNNNNNTSATVAAAPGGASAGTSTTNNFVTAAPAGFPTFNFNDPVSLASVLGQQQHLLQQQVPMLSQQALVEHLLPLQQQLQQQQLRPQQQHPQTTTIASSDNKSNNSLVSATNTNGGMFVLPAMQPSDPQVLWQRALQSLTAGQVAAAAAQFVGTAAAAANNGTMNQQPPNFQQLMASLPMPTELSQLALMYPLQPQQQAQQQQQVQPAMAAAGPMHLHQQSLPVSQPSQYLLQASAVGQPLLSDFTNNSNIFQVVQNNGNGGSNLSAVAAGSSNSMDIDDSKQRSEDDNDMNNDMSYKDMKGGPTVVSFNSNKCDFGFNEKPPERKSEEELEKMSESDRRRYERNLREQQRSYKISQQIKQLRDVLAESNVPFRPNKYSILVSVAEYIKQLQSRAIMLDAEHQRLIDTIKKTNDMVSSGVNMSLSDEEESNNDGRFSSQLQSGFESATSSLLLVQGIDYRNVFDHCPHPMGIATLDGRVLAANEGFEDLLCCGHGQMADQSLFVYIRNHQEIFEAMAALLKKSSLAVETVEGAYKDQQLLYWCGQVTSPRNQRVPFTITLTSTVDNNPKYFSLSAGSATID